MGGGGGVQLMMIMGWGGGGGRNHTEEMVVDGSVYAFRGERSGWGMTSSNTRC